MGARMLQHEIMGCQGGAMLLAHQDDRFRRSTTVVVGARIVMPFDDYFEAGQSLTLGRCMLDDAAPEALLLEDAAV